MLDTLFLAWHDTQRREYHTVGRLLRMQETDGPKFEFAYVRGVQQACQRGFKPFLAFPHLDQVYRSDELFPFFANRVISPGRPDYDDHVRRLGLDARTADEMTILARSGGVRATDSLVLFPLPSQEPTLGCYQTHFLVYDVPGAVSERVARLGVGESLTALVDPDRSIALRTKDSYLVGYLPSYLLGDALRLADLCSYLEVSVEQVNPPPAPIQQRLLCRLRSCWPTGFVPFRDPVLLPIPSEAGDTSHRPGLDRLYATIIETNESRIIPLLYREGTWASDGIRVLADQVLVEGKSYAIESRDPFYADFAHGDRRIVITE